MSETTASRTTTVRRVYLIITLFVALILCLVVLFQIQIDALTAIRTYVGGEGLWAKAQKGAVHSIEHYVISGDEADYLAYRRQIQVTLGDRRARIELQKKNPDIAVARGGFLQGRNHPDDIESAIRFFRRFQHNAYMAQVIGHWTTGDRMIAELNGVAEALHEEIASGRNNPEVVRSYLTKLNDINRQVTVEEELFSSTLAEASRWANDVSRNLIYAIALLFVVLGIVLSWPLITRIRRTEKALFNSEEQMRSIFEHVDDLIYLMESDGKFNSLSPSFERITGWPVEEWIGKPFAPIIHPDDLPRAIKVFQNALSGQSTPSFELSIATKSGEYFNSELSIVPVTPGGKIVAIGIARDITERKQAEERIRQLNKELETKVQERSAQLLAAQDELVRKEKLSLLGQVAGSVGHELRNPLAVMNNAVYFLQTVLADADETTREYLEIIKNEIDDADRIVADLLDSVRTKPPQPAAVSIGELIGQTLHTLTVPDTITVTLDLPETLPPVWVDGLQIQQVLRNLIGNSVEAMVEGGTLAINAVENSQDGTVTVSVRDTGCGMTPEVLAKLFQPLFTTKAGGIGLGLVVVKNLTEANGGTVTVESAVGQGTTFTVVLPTGKSIIKES
ncbi:MAG: PAS domain S-box protein [Desulfobulbaceae bacterium]|jgi:PAS domain S-box-containing protein|nr:PAS domain S-box protein [Desulfobulbaceae bacterium]